METKDKLSRIERDKIENELRSGYEIHKDINHYLISSITIQKYYEQLFNSGWNSALMDEWRLCKDFMPENDEEVLVASMINSDRSKITYSTNSYDIFNKKWKSEPLPGYSILAWKYIKPFIPKDYEDNCNG